MNKLKRLFLRALLYFLELIQWLLHQKLVVKILDKLSGERTEGYYGN
ncbi:MAG: hypothetical protein PWQ63_1684 [Methanolobus sp.]|jgi:hypothetical protein|nr:hypothetical protein [Methanolobus sp.]